jgi:hypothetical protein
VVQISAIVIGHWSLVIGIVYWNLRSEPHGGWKLRQAADKGTWIPRAV